MKSIVFLSILALALCDYPPAKPSESYKAPGTNVAHTTESPVLTSFSEQNNLAYPSYYLPSYPLTYSSNPNLFYPSYYNHYSHNKKFNYPSKYPYNYSYNYKPFSSANLEGNSIKFPPFLDVFPPTSSPILPPVLGGVLPPSLPLPYPPSIVPQPSLKPPVELPAPLTTGFTSQFYPSYNLFQKHFPMFPLPYPLPTYSSNIFGNKEKNPKPLETSYGPPASGSVESPAPTETSDNSSAPFPQEATSLDGNASETPEQISFTSGQEYGPPSPKN